MLMMKKFIYPISNDVMDLMNINSNQLEVEHNAEFNNIIFILVFKYLEITIKFFKKICQVLQ